MQKMLFSIFGTQLLKPTNPPPVDSSGDTPGWTVPTTTTTVKTASAVHVPAGHFLVNLAASSSTAPTTTTTVAPEGDQFFDPYPCNP